MVAALPRRRPLNDAGCVSLIEQKGDTMDIANEPLLGEEANALNELPRVTVVVPVFNGASTIAQCIESLLAQTYRNDLMRIIVVDNNSADNTAAIVLEYPVTLAHERVQTSYAARNQGISLSETEIIAFLDADCVAGTSWLRDLVEPFGNAEIGVSGGPILSQGPQRNLVEAFLAKTNILTSSRFPPNEPLALPTGNVAYRRSALDTVGIFDAAMPGGGDIDLAWRVQVYGGYSSTYVPEAAVYQKHRNSLAGVYRQYKGYGTSEIVLATLYRGCSFHKRTPAYHMGLMARQVVALFRYLASFSIRLTHPQKWHADRLYLAWPLLWLVVDFSNLTGKILGLAATRFFRQNPYSTNSREVKRV